MGEPLPIAKTAVCMKSIPEIRSLVKFKDGYNDQTKEFTKACHKLEIIVNIDENNLHEITVYPGAFKNFERLLSTFDAQLESKIPVIAFYDNSSVIACHEKNKGYQFLEEWNGKYGTDLFISFDQKKPQFGKPAMKALKTRNTVVVFDLLKIMSMPPNNIKAEKHWGSGSQKMPKILFCFNSILLADVKKLLPHHFLWHCFFDNI